MLREDESFSHEEFIKAMFATKSARQSLPPTSLQEKVDALEQEVSQLRAECAELKGSIAYTEKWITDWFRTHLSTLAASAAEDFMQKRNIDFDLRKQIQQEVAAIFDRESNELGKAIFEAVCNAIQPYALKQR